METPSTCHGLDKDPPQIAIDRLIETSAIVVGNGSLSFKPLLMDVA
jgi:hypothetical protein